MKAPFSAYLARIAPGLKELIALLRQRYDYVSVLSTDTTGFQVAISQRAKSVTRRIKPLREQLKNLQRILDKSDYVYTMLETERRLERQIGRNRDYER